MAPDASLDASEITRDFKLTGACCAVSRDFEFNDDRFLRQNRSSSLTPNGTHIFLSQEVADAIKRFILREKREVTAPNTIDCESILPLMDDICLADAFG